MGFESIYLWDDPIKTGAIFGTVLVTLVSLCYFSLISVVAYTCIALLLAVAAAKLYAYVMVTFLKKDVANPVAKLSAVEIAIPSECVSSMASKATDKINVALKELRRLFMVENMLDSVKFGLSMWVLTYIGSWFNAMTLVLVFWVGLFTVPKIYLNYKAQIDPLLDQVKSRYGEITEKVTAMIPHAKTAVPETKKEE